jgi:short-subunit dehydrogenase
MSDQPLVLLTGASAGIGAALARVIAADGYDLLLVARRQDRLDALAAELPTRTHTLPLDLQAPDAGDRLEAAVATLGRPVDVLVNNAGYGVSGLFVDGDAKRLVGMADLNIRAPVDLTRRFLPGMIARRRGGVLNVASTAAFQPGPRCAVYYASKAFVLSWSEALSEETRGTGVTVTALCPGPTLSEFGAVAGMDRTRLFRHGRRMTAEAVAETGWKAFRAGRRVVITGATNRLAAVGGKLLPHRVLLPIVSLLQRDV